MFPLGSTPSKRPKRRVESYRILYAHILHALSLPGHPLRVTEKATHGEQMGLYSWHSQMGTSITINIVPKCEVCPRDHGKVVESLQGPLGSTPSKRPKRRVESYRIIYAHILHALSLPGHPLRVTEKATHGEQVGLYSWHSRTGTSITINIVPKCEVCPRDHGKVVESLRGSAHVWYVLTYILSTLLRKTDKPIYSLFNQLSSQSKQSKSYTSR